VKLGVLAGAFNPVTCAHVALAEAGRAMVDEVICIVPRAYPHKRFEGAGFEHRLAMLRVAGLPYTVTESGLFIDIARELRLARPEPEIYFLCGRDAAERVLHWDYGDPGATERMLDEFGLLVAARQGRFDPPERWRGRVRALPVHGRFDEISSTEVRRRIAAGEAWEHLVPEPIVAMVREIYGRRAL